MAEAFSSHFSKFMTFLVENVLSAEAFLKLMAIFAAHNFLTIAEKTEKFILNNEEILPTRANLSQVKIC